MFERMKVEKEEGRGRDMVDIVDPPVVTVATPTAATTTTTAVAVMVSTEVDIDSVLWTEAEVSARVGEVAAERQRGHFPWR